LNVKARAEAVGTFRHVNVFLMETLAAWVPSTPEMEVKVLFGRHLWLIAQLADEADPPVAERQQVLDDTYGSPCRSILNLQALRDPQQFRHAPRLRDTAAWGVRRIPVKNLADAAYPGLLEVPDEGLEQRRYRLI